MRQSNIEIRQNGGGVQTAVQSGVPATGAMGIKEIPYDYVAEFELEGVPGNRVQDVINISVDGAFMATAIGYSFIPAEFPPDPPRTPSGQPPSVVPPIAVPGNLRNLSFLVGDLLQAITADPRELVKCLVRNICGIDFKYSIIDSATGRELQNLPIHNIAGLGEPHGERPFRPFAKPILFMPRSTIRIEIIEISKGSEDRNSTDYSIYGYDNQSGERVLSQLQIVLHGYKMLGYGTGMP